MIDKRVRKDSFNRKFGKKGGFFVQFTTTFSLIIIGLIIGIIFGSLLFYFNIYIKARRGTVILENYINQDSKVASEILKNKGFKVIVIGGEGKVIKMDPPPNTRVKIRSEVKLFTESIKTVTMELPDFKYAWYKTVQTLLREVNIIPSVRYIPASEFYGTVISTSPTPKSQVKSWDSITLFVSSGSSSISNQSNQNEGINQEGINQEESSTSSTPIEIIPPSVDVKNYEEVQQSTEPNSGNTSQPIQTQPDQNNQSSTESTENGIGTEGGQF